MHALLVAGSPAERSRTAALLAEAGVALRAHGLVTESLALRELPAEPLLAGRTDHPALRAAFERVAAAQVVVLASPIYKAAYSGLLKVFLDLLPQDALAGKWAWPLATGGSTAHLLALDHALRPVLDSLGTRRLLPTVYATEAQVAAHGGVVTEIATRLRDVAGDLAFALEGEAELRRLGRHRRANVGAEAARCS